jgi:hypothetical protein
MTYKGAVVHDGPDILHIDPTEVYVEEEGSEETDTRMK